MAATQLIEALQTEVAALKGQFEMIAPKFANYDLMALENGPWKAEFERLLKVQEADLKGLYDDANTSIGVMNATLATLHAAPPQTAAAARSGKCQGPKTYKHPHSLVRMRNGQNGKSRCRTMWTPSTQA